MEVAVALDTNRLSDLLQGDVALAERLSLCERVLIPLMVLAEMQFGFLAGSQRRHNEWKFQAFLARSGVEVLLPDRDTAVHYAHLRLQLQRAGTPIPANAIWIAALALQFGLRLLTRDRHFQAIPQLLIG